MDKTAISGLLWYASELWPPERATNYSRWWLQLNRPIAQQLIFLPSNTRYCQCNRLAGRQVRATDCIESSVIDTRSDSHHASHGQQISTTDWLSSHHQRTTDCSPTIQRTLLHRPQPPATTSAPAHTSDTQCYFRDQQHRWHAIACFEPWQHTVHVNTVEEHVIDQRTICISRFRYLNVLNINIKRCALANANYDTVKSVARSRRPTSRQFSNIDKKPSCR